MDVIGFLYVSLGSSTVELHDSLGSRRARACSEWLVLVVKMSTVFEEFTTEEQRSVVRFFFFCGQKDSMQRI
jgi:hypothetical protein